MLLSQVLKKKRKFKQRYPEWVDETSPRSQRLFSGNSSPKSGLLPHDLMIMRLLNPPPPKTVKVLLVLVMLIMASHSSLLEEEKQGVFCIKFYPPGVNQTFPVYLGLVVHAFNLSPRKQRDRGRWIS